jgi:hypothetical protein
MAQVDAKLYKEYKRLADRADKRLLRLERLAERSPNLYGDVLAYAYKSAEKSIEHWDNGKKYDKPRFARRTPRNETAMKMKMKDIQAFLDMKTSTQKGIRDSYIKRAKSLNKKFNANFTWQEWARFGIREFWDRKDKKFTYNEMIRVAKVQKQKAEAIAHYKKVRKSFRTGTGKGSVKPSFARQAKMKIRGDNLMNQIKEELNYQEASDLLSADINLVEDAINTIFTPKKSIVMQETEKKLAESGLSYDTMFK